MRSPPKIPQRAMVRIWVASLHQKNSTYESTLRFLFCSTAKLTGRVDSNSIGRRPTFRRQKSPCGAFLDARLAQSTRAHQKDQRSHCADFLFYPASQVSLLRVDSNSMDPPNRPAGKKPLRGFFGVCNLRFGLTLQGFCEMILLEKTIVENRK